MVWTQFETREETEEAIGRLEFAGYDRAEIDRIEDAEGRWRVGIYIDQRDERRVHAIMSDPEAPTSGDLLNSIVIFGAAALAGMVLAYLLPGARRS